MKKILALLLAIVMVFAFTACKAETPSGDTDKPGTSDDGTTTELPKVSLPTLTYLYNTSDAHKAIGEYLQAAFKNIGLTMNLENQEWATFLNTRKDGQYSVARNGWVADYNDPICFLDMWTTASGNNDVQFGKGAHANLKMYDLDLTKWGYETKVEDGTWAETYDVLISTIKSCTDTAKRYELMHLAEDILMSTGCIVPLYYYTDLYMIDDKVEGFFSNPLGYKYFMYTTVDGATEAINVCLASEPDTLDPALNSAVDGATMLSHLFSGLAKWAQGEDGKLVIVPDCAVELPEGVVNEDGTVTYTYTLKDGLKWSNGDALTAADFVNAWQRAASPALGADYGYMFEVVKGYAEMWETNDAGEFVNPDAKLAVEAVDEKTIKITLANAVSYWNELLAFPTYFPVHSSALTNESWATEAATYICNGAYTIESWTHESLITLAKNASYHGAADVTMNKINCYLSDDANNMLANFRKGDWVLIDDVPTNEIATLKTEFPEEFVIAGQIGTYYVCWNVNEKIYNPENTTLTAEELEAAQAEIRSALGLLFDRNYIVESVSQAGEIPASSFVAMGMTNPDGTEFYKTANGGASVNGYDGYYDVSKEAFKTNVDKALEILGKYYNLAK